MLLCFRHYYFCLVTKSCLTLCNPMNCSPPGSSVHGISQARILNWVSISFFGDLLDPGIEPGSPAWQVDSLVLSHQGNPLDIITLLNSKGLLVSGSCII